MYMCVRALKWLLGETKGIEGKNFAFSPLVLVTQAVYLYFYLN